MPWGGRHRKQGARPLSRDPRLHQCLLASTADRCATPREYPRRQGRGHAARAWKDQRAAGTRPGGLRPRLRPDPRKTGTGRTGRAWPGRASGGRTAKGFLRETDPLAREIHPPAVHFPIALLTAAAVAELLRMATGKPAFDAITRYCIWFGTLTAVIAGALGWCAGGFRLTDPSWVLMTHRWLGTSTVACAGLVLLLSEASRVQIAAGPGCPSELHCLSSRYSYRPPGTLAARWSSASITTPGRNKHRFASARREGDIRNCFSKLNDPGKSALRSLCILPQQLRRSPLE